MRATHGSRDTSSFPFGFQRDDGGEAGPLERLPLEAYAVAGAFIGIVRDSDRDATAVRERQADHIRTVDPVVPHGADAAAAGDRLFGCAVVTAVTLEQGNERVVALVACAQDHHRLAAQVAVGIAGPAFAPDRPHGAVAPEPAGVPSAHEKPGNRP